MNWFNSFSILTSGSILWILLFFILLAAFSLFIYKYTIPKVTFRLRTFLIILRSLIFGLILFLIFEPALSFIQRERIESMTYVYIDNSNSIAAKDSLNKLNQTVSFIDELKVSGEINARFFTFGKKIDSIDAGQLKKIKFGEPLTNFSNVIDHIKKNNAQINSVVILSDGIITDGIDPTYQAEKLQIPIFTIGVGDSAQKKDVEIYNVLHNQFIYAGKITQIDIAIKNNGYENKQTQISLFEEKTFIESKNITLSETGIDKISFNYKPASGGEKKLRVVVSPLEGEASAANNSRTFFINVLDTKLKICLIAGAPSTDVSAIAKSISVDKNIQLKKLIQISQNKFWNDVKPAVIDSADLLFIVDFPTSNSSQALIDKIASVMTQNKPFFFLLSGNVVLSKLGEFENALPFSFSKPVSEFLQVQPDLNTESFSSYFSTGNNQRNIWDNLPPVSQFATELTSKPGSKVLVKSQVKNIPIGNPLIISRSLGKQRAFSILAGDIWKWQLQTAEKNPEFFDNFINDIVKWLSASSLQKQFNITTDKKFYATSEEVTFTAEMYDQTFTPIDTANITLKVSSSSGTRDLTFSPNGNGLYSSGFLPVESGDYSFEGTGEFNGMKLKSAAGRFSVGEVQIEKLDTRMRTDFLKSLANLSGGNYYSLDNHSGLMKLLARLNQNSSKEKISKDEYQLWSNKWVLFFIILLFATEWFTRKRAGMI
ncbi:MAG: hypothetical protein NTX65_17010 [Ignavibacteriales bacterium]|nr:hypothetical protein [Ignavibacteriales bacterium]